MVAALGLVVTADKFEQRVAIFNNQSSTVRTLIRRGPPSRPR
jgi:hypothetical protein